VVAVGTEAGIVFEVVVAETAVDFLRIDSEAVVVETVVGVSAVGIVVEVSAAVV